MTIIAGFMMPHPPLAVPQVGRGDENKIRNTIAGYERAAAEIAAIKPDTIVLTSPHSVMYLDYFHISPGREARGDFSQFRVSGYEKTVRYDEQFVANLADACLHADIPAGTLGEQDSSLDHGTMVPLHFVDQKYTDYRLVRIGLSGESLLKHYELGQLIEQTSVKLGRRTVFIASGDLSHKLKEDGPYGFAPDGPVFDERIMDIMSRAEFGKLFDFSPEFCSAAGECGHRSLVIMAGAFDRKKVRAEKFSYECPYGVGYGICSFYPEEIDGSRDFGIQAAGAEARKKEMIRAGEDEYVKLARNSLETYVKSKAVMEMPDILPEEMKKKRAGVFVSLKKDGNLRGCIGTISPVRENIAREIIENAVSACAHDPRFSPVREDELDDIVYSVDVLDEPEQITDKNQLDVKKYGVIVSSGSRRGLLLPNLEGVDDVDEQIRIARQKAGIGAEEPAALERFQVVRHR